MGIAPECDGADAYGYGKDACAGEHSGGIFRKGAHCDPPGGVGGADQEYGEFLQDANGARENAARCVPTFIKHHPS